MNSTIDKKILGKYICQNQIAWQKWDGLIEISHSIGSPSYDELSALWGKMSEEFAVVTRDEILDTSFSQLAERSTENDVLILAGDEVLLCIPKFEYEKLSA